MLRLLTTLALSLICLAPAPSHAVTAEQAIKVIANPMTRERLTNVATGGEEQSAEENAETTEASEVAKPGEIIKQIDGIEALSTVSSYLSLDQRWLQFLDQYQAYLENQPMRQTWHGKAILTAIVTIISLIVSIGGRFGARFAASHIGRLFSSERVNRLKSHRIVEDVSDNFTLSLRILGLTWFAAVFVLWIISLSMVWFPFLLDFIGHPISLALMGAALNSALTIAIGAAIWELCYDLAMAGIRRSSDSHSGRYETLAPVVRTVLLVIIGAIFGAILLGQWGVNVAPLLAGAGFLGVALGFGAQSMVKDFLTGFTILMEDSIQVGDVVKLGGNAGLVEKITLRKIQLRNLSGTVMTIPYSEVSIVENMTKDFSFYVMDVGVGYGENTDRVCDIMRQVDTEMREEDSWGDDMLEPIEILGVDQFADSAVIIKARLKTKPIRQWAVGREYNRRLKHAFDREGVEIPFPQRVFWHRQEAPLAVLPEAK